MCSDELANLVLHGVSDHMSEVLGGRLSITETWLVHHFPNRAPAGYVRSGYVFNDSIDIW